jgi:hypothetical protein
MNDLLYGNRCRSPSACDRAFNAVQRLAQALAEDLLAEQAQAASGPRRVA